MAHPASLPPRPGSGGSTGSSPPSLPSGVPGMPHPASWPPRPHSSDRSRSSLPSLLSGVAVASPETQAAAAQLQLSTRRSETGLAKRQAASAEKALEKAQRKRLHAEKLAAEAEAEAQRHLAQQRVAQAEVEFARQAQRAAERQLRQQIRVASQAEDFKHCASNQSDMREDIKPTCVLCLAAPAEVAATPCGHRLYCDGCCHNHWPEKADCAHAPIIQCAICRRRVDGILRIF